MKIVDRKTFLALPRDTLYSKYEPCVFKSFQIKGSTIHPNDFATQRIVDAVAGNFLETVDEAERTGESFSMDFNSLGRDGLFDNDQLFAIWEEADILELIDVLSQLVKK